MVEIRVDSRLSGVGSGAGRGPRVSGQIAPNDVRRLHALEIFRNLPWIAQPKRTAVTLHQYRVHAKHIGYGQVIVRHRLLRQLAVEAVKFVETGRKHRARRDLAPSSGLRSPFDRLIRNS